MADDDKKPPSLALLALGKGKADEDEKAESESTAGLEMAMQDFLDAFDAKDTAAMAAAFSDAVAMCDEQY